MLRDMSWSQFMAWREFASLEPFGDERADYRVAQLTSLMANVYNDKSRRPQGWQPLDFMPYTMARAAEARDPRAPTALSTKDAWNAWASGMVTVARAKPVNAEEGS